MMRKALSGSSNYVRNNSEVYLGTGLSLMLLVTGRVDTTKTRKVLSCVGHI
jgi:hypothetical protein